MPRRKPVSENQTLEPNVLALPAPRVIPSHKHEHKVDAYQTPPGAVPGKVSNITITQGPPTRALTKEDEQKRELARADRRMRTVRCRRYMDEMARVGGNQVMALATVFNISIEEAAERQIELHDDVMSGLVHTDVGELLKQHSLDQASRAYILSRHMWSDNPAASLKAADMANEMEGDRGETGSFEQYLRLSKAQQEK